MNITVSDYPIDFLSERLINIALGKEITHLYPFTGISVNVTAIENNIRNFFDNSKRKKLHDIILGQYLGIELSKQQQQNIAFILQENSFTVTTGQQIHVGLGPMYVWNKIESVLNTVSVLKLENQACNYVPVFWMATEDHDFEEIRDVVLFGEKYSWNTNQKGPVGGFETSELKEVFDAIKLKFTNDLDALARLKIVEDIYLKVKMTLAQATRLLVQFIYGESGLLVIDPNDVQLKSMSKNLWHQDILNRSVYPAYLEQNSHLQKADLATPAYAREINCFYIEKGQRERIAYSNEKFTLVDSKREFTVQEMEQLIENSPEHISPNVLLRPLYQQSILPNVVYIGGPAEFAYWMQCSKAFEVCDIPAPRIQLRFSSVYLAPDVFKKLQKLNLTTNDMWASWEEIELKIIQMHEETFTLDANIDKLNESFENVRQSLYDIKSPLLKGMKKQQDEMLKALKKIAVEYKNSAKNNSQLSKDLVNAKNLKNEYFDVQNAQERRLFWLEIYLKSGLVLNLVNSMNKEIISFLLIH
jgi:bacillithiol biosynthesis cysteine-adding enzyme BshC